MEIKDIKDLAEQQGRAFEEYKKANDARLAEIEKSGKASADTEEKLKRIDDELKRIETEAKSSLVEIEKRANRPNLGSDDPKDLAKATKNFNLAVKAHALSLGRPVPAALDADGYKAYRETFETIFRKGDKALTDQEVKTMMVGSDPDGGYVVPFEVEAAIDRVVENLSAMRTLARVQPISAASYKKLVKTQGASARWVGETEAGGETDTPKMAELEFVPGKMESEPHATSDILEDASINIEGWLSEEVSMEFMEAEGSAYISGNGVKKPRGFLSYEFVANASYSWGKIGYIASGGASDFASSNPSDALIDLQHALKRQYRPDASWLMNDATLGKIRKFKGSDNNYLWRPGLEKGVLGELLGAPVVTDDFMPDVGANTYPLAYGAWKRGYLIVDRRGIVVLRDPYTRKPYVKFYTTKRVGGGVQNFEAIKVMKIASS